MERDLESAGECSVAAEVIDDPLCEVELPIVDERVADAIADALVVVDAPHREILASRYDRRRGVPVDRAAQHHAPALVTIRRNVGSAAAEADPQWSPGTN